MSKSKIPVAPKTKVRMNPGKKPKVVFFYDRDGWAFHNITRECFKHLSDEFDILTVPYVVDGKPVDYGKMDADVAILMWYGYGHMFNLVPSSCRKITAVYDESLWTHRPTCERQFRESAQQSHLMLGASPSIERLVRSACEHPVMPCYDGVNPEKFPALAPREGLLEGERLVVGWCGNSDPNAHGDNKGLHLIKQVAAAMPHVDFEIQDRRGKKVWIPHDQMTDWYKKVDVMLCMSRYEGTPNPILEASSSAKAWISTDVGIVKVMASSATFDRPGMVINRSASALKHAIQYMHQHREECVKMGQSGRSAIDSNWSWKAKVEQFRHAIRAALQ